MNDLKQFWLVNLPRLACARFHDEHVRDVKARHIQADEIWSFNYSKAKKVPTAKAAPTPGRRGPYRKKNSN